MVICSISQSQIDALAPILKTPLNMTARIGENNFQLVSYKEQYDEIVESLALDEKTVSNKCGNMTVELISK